MEKLSENQITSSKRGGCFQSHLAEGKRKKPKNCHNDEGEQSGSGERSHHFNGES